MRSRKREPLLGLLLGTSLHLLEKLRDRLPDNMGAIKDRAWETYETASDRVSRATNVLRGKEESRIIGKVGALLIGVGVGLLIAPASGEETRADIADKVADLGDKVREQTGLSQFLLQGPISAFVGTIGIGTSFEDVPLVEDLGFGTC